MKQTPFSVKGTYVKSAQKAVGPARKKSAVKAFFSKLWDSIKAKDIGVSSAEARKVGIATRAAESNVAMAIAMHALEDPKLLKTLEGMEKSKTGNVRVTLNKKGELVTEVSGEPIKYADSGAKYLYKQSNRVPVLEIMNIVRVHKGSNFRAATQVAIQAIEDASVKSGISSLKNQGFTHIVINPEGEVTATKLKTNGKPGEFIPAVKTTLELSPARHLRIPISEIEELIKKHGKKAAADPDHIHNEKRKWGF